MGAAADRRAMRRANRQTRRAERGVSKQEKREWRRGFIEGLAPKVLDKFSNAGDASKSAGVDGLLTDLEGFGTGGDSPKSGMDMKALLPLAVVAFLLLKK